MSAGAQSFWGKYRGQVKDNDDPLHLGRVKVKVPDIFGDDLTGWALPCFPFAGPGKGLFMVPPSDAWVWVEFEYGDPQKPIWTGCFFPDDPVALAPTLAQLLPLTGIDKDKLVLKTAEWLVTVESGKVSIASLLGPLPRARIEVSASDIKLTNEQAPGVPSPPSATVTLSGPTVSINGSALEVT